MTVEEVIEALGCYDKSYEVIMKPIDAPVEQVYADANEKEVYLNTIQ